MDSGLGIPHSLFSTIVAYVQLKSWDSIHASLTLYPQ